MTETFDVLVVGAGIAGTSLAFALSHSSSKSRPLKILLLERNLDEPQRIVGKLLQPGGVNALKTLSLSGTLKDIGAIAVKGYGVVHRGKNVHIPYPNKAEGLSFHHGRFVQALRREAIRAPGVTTVEATVTELVECSETHRVLGVKARPKNSAETQVYLADLSVIADGCFSNLRGKVLDDIGSRAITKSNFIGAILE